MPISASLSPSSRTSRLFFFHRPNKSSERGAGDDAIELGTVVADHADVLDHHVINFPLPVDTVESVIDRQRRTIFVDDLGIHLRIVLILSLADVEGRSEWYRIQYYRRRISPSAWRKPLRIPAVPRVCGPPSDAPGSAWPSRKSRTLEK